MIIRITFVQTLVVCWLLSAESFDLRDAITARLKFHKGHVGSEDVGAEGSSYSSSGSSKDSTTGHWTFPKIGVGFRLYVLGGKKKEPSKCKDCHHQKAKEVVKFPRTLMSSPHGTDHHEHLSHHLQVFSPQEETSYGLNQRFPMHHHQEGGNNIMHAPLFHYRQRPSGIVGGGQSLNFPYRSNYQSQPSQLHSGQEEQHQSYGIPEDIHTNYVVHSGGGGLRDSGSYNGDHGVIRDAEGFQNEVRHRYPEDINLGGGGIMSDEPGNNGHHSVSYTAAGSHRNSEGLGGYSTLRGMPSFKPIPGHPTPESFGKQAYYVINEDMGHTNSPGHEDEQEYSASQIHTLPSTRSHKLSGDEKLLKTLKLVLDIARATKHGDIESPKQSVLIRNPNSLRNFKREAHKRSSSSGEAHSGVQKTVEIKDSLEGDLTKLIRSLESKKTINEK